MKSVSLFTRLVSGKALLLAVVACAGLLVMVSNPANSGGLDKNDVETLIAKYIAENGEALKASIAAAENRAQNKAVEGLINTNTPTLGPKDAAVTIIEFSDYECPFCARVQTSVQQLQKEYKGKVRFAFKQLPLPMHPGAIPAAQAGLAAHQQGKFWEYHEKLWENAQNINEATLVRIAEELKLNMKRFNADRASEKIAMMVQTDLEDAAKVGARGTPFFFINGTPLSGAQPVEEFRKVIDAALKAAP
jgi:protein-disulfide isomerase